MSDDPKPDERCGNCGNRYADHFFEDEIYCNSRTNGDIWTPIETEQRVCEDIRERQRRGVEKYGTTVAANPLELRQWLQHMYEEMLDAAVYLRRALDEIDRNQKGQSE